MSCCINNVRRQKVEVGVEELEWPARRHDFNLSTLLEELKSQMLTHLTAQSDLTIVFVPQWSQIPTNHSPIDTRYIPRRERPAIAATFWMCFPEIIIPYIQKCLIQFLLLLSRWGSWPVCGLEVCCSSVWFSSDLRDSSSERLDSWWSFCSWFWLEVSFSGPKENTSSLGA